MSHEVDDSRKQDFYCYGKQIFNMDFRVWYNELWFFDSTEVETTFKIPPQTFAAFGLAVKKIPLILRSLHNARLIFYGIGRMQENTITFFQAFVHLTETTVAVTDFDCC